MDDTNVCISLYVSSFSDVSTSTPIRSDRWTLVNVRALWNRCFVLETEQKRYKNVFHKQNNKQTVLVSICNIGVNKGNNWRRRKLICLFFFFLKNQIARRLCFSLAGCFNSIRQTNFRSNVSDQISGKHYTPVLYSYQIYIFYYQF